MKKKLLVAIAIALAFALVLGTLSSCSAKPKMTNKVTVWCWDPNFNVYAMKQAAAVYNKAHADVNIEVVDMAQDIEAKITSGLQANGAGLPDVALFQDFRIEQFLHDYPNAFVDLKAAGVDYSQFASYKVGPMTVGAKVYGIPFDTGSTGLWLRTDYIKAAGLNPDDYFGKNLNWSDIIKLGVAVKAKTGKPLLAYQSDNFDMLRIVVQSTGGQFFKDDGSLNLQSDAFKKSLALFKELNDKGLLYQVVGWSDWINAINSDRSAGFLNAIWMVGTVKSRPENAGKYMVIPTPLIEGVPGAANASNNGGSSWYVFASSPQQGSRSRLPQVRLGDFDPPRTSSSTTRSSRARAPWAPISPARAAPTTPPTTTSSTRASPSTRTSPPGWPRSPSSSTRPTTCPCATLWPTRR